MEQENDAVAASIASGAIRGKLLADVQKTYDARVVRIETLRATPEGPKPFDRAAFYKRFTAKSLGMLVLPGSAQQLRAAMRKLDVTELTPAPKDNGWSFEAEADLAGLVTGGTPAERAG